MLERIMYIEKCMRRYLNAAFGTCGLPFSEGIVLMAVENNRSFNQDNISALLGIDKFRIAKILSILENKGLIARETNAENKREKLMKLTPKGDKIFQKVSQAATGWQNICLDGFSNTESEEMEQMLDRFIFNLVKYEKTV